MKKQAFNPYLPLDTYIPDGEPHVFGDRVYVYGSHDKEGGEAFCMLPYECWSAPVEDLTDWRREGIIYEASQDPGCGGKNLYMYAPDVVQGCDGRYYLYYAMSGARFTEPIHVAVCDTPGGKFEYYGAVRTPDGKELSRDITFDPAVLNDNGRIWLYYGWSLGFPQEMMAGIEDPKMREKLVQVQMMLFDKTREEIENGPHSVMGADVVELEADMLTIKGDVKRIVPGQLDAGGTSFEGHAFFEASSIRRIGNTYYFAYSSQHMHELCYATSKYPDRDFTYQGVLVSNGDLGLEGNTFRRATTGNNHGGLVEVNGQWYIFYHRQTHKTAYSRQGCAEPIRFEDGRFFQAEMTSCGLNGGPMKGEGTYPAPICCQLYRGQMPHQGNEPTVEPVPHVTHREGQRFVAEIMDGTVLVYKYFHLEGSCRLILRCRGTGAGVWTANGISVSVSPSESWQDVRLELQGQGVQPLTIHYAGEGMAELLEFTLEKI